MPLTVQEPEALCFRVVRPLVRVCPDAGILRGHVFL